MNKPEEQFEECDPTPAIAIGHHMADLQFDIAQSSYEKRLNENYQGFCLHQAKDEALSRYLGEQVAVIRLDERLRFIGRTIIYTASVAAIPIGIAIAVGMGYYSLLLIIPSFFAGMWLSAVNH